MGMLGFLFWVVGSLMVSWHRTFEAVWKVLFRYDADITRIRGNIGWQIADDATGYMEVIGWKNGISL